VCGPIKGFVMMNSNFSIEKRGNLKQLRVESCIGTILTIKRSIKNIKNIDPLFMFQFSRLESIIPQIKVESITENDVEKIEKATNNLFKQMKSFFGSNKEIKAYDGTRH
jgi:hypothetical protein